LEGKDVGTNKKALVTGASRGIGKAIATALAKKGCDLYLTCNNNIERLEALSKELSGTYGVSVKAYAFPISNEDKVNEMFNQIPYLDILVNNAGISYVGLLQDMSYEDWNNIISTNLSSCFLTCRKSIPEMVKRGRGKIINISSVWGNVGASMEVAYSASKGGVNSFTKALAKELAPSNIQVNAIACGLIDTDMNKCFDEDDIKAVIEEIPADRIGKPEEVAGLVLALCEGNDYLTGQIINLDGGWI
jgi:3-oxoacyl-[acyl-carrier protein] reductase